MSCWSNLTNFMKLKLTLTTLQVEMLRRFLFALKEMKQKNGWIIFQEKKTTYFQLRGHFSNVVKSSTRKKKRNLTWKNLMTSFRLTILSQGKFISRRSRECLCWHPATWLHMIYSEIKIREMCKMAKRSAMMIAIQMILWMMQVKAGAQDASSYSTLVN